MIKWDHLNCNFDLGAIWEFEKMQDETTNETDRNQQLDYEFDQHLAGMKRFIIQMEDKNGMRDFSFIQDLMLHAG